MNLVYIGASLLLAFVICLPYGPVGRRQVLRNVSYKGAGQAHLRETKPDWVLIGNSILEEGIDEKLLAEYTGEAMESLVLTGGGSAWMYLALKNVVMPSVREGTYVAFFFRKTRLTDPGWRVAGRYKERLDRVALEDEPVLDRLAYLQASGWLQRAIWYAFPLTRYDVRHIRDGFVKSIAAGVSPARGDVKRLERSLSRTLANKRMVPELLSRYQIDAERSAAPSALRFADRVNASFLPEIIRLAREANLKPVFVVCPERRDIASSSEDPYAAYTADLRSYLSERGIPLVDVRSGVEWKAEHFAVGDHLDRDTGRPVFTRALGRCLADLSY